MNDSVCADPQAKHKIELEFTGMDKQYCAPECSPQTPEHLMWKVPWDKDQSLCFVHTLVAC